MPDQTVRTPRCRCGGEIRILLAGRTLIAECPRCRVRTAARDDTAPRLRREGRKHAK